MKTLIKPPRLRRGDRVAIVSLSAGIAGDAAFYHRYEQGVKRLREVFGLEAVPMPNALKGHAYLNARPEARAQDLMDAFRDPAIKGVVCAIGGEDTVRLLPYIDFEVLRQNPKVFLGYSDSTANHFMLYKAGVGSFYGPALLADFAENGGMHEYTVDMLQRVLFEGVAPLDIPPSPEWTCEFLDWANEAYDSVPRKMESDPKGHELLQGQGRVRGRLLGGCVDVFPMLTPTELWPEREDWKGAILFLEASEEKIPPSAMLYILRGLAAQGIFAGLAGLVMGKPYGGVNYEEYKTVLLTVAREAGREDLPVLYNLSFGHNAPMCTLPYGALAEIDCESKAFRLLEAAVE